MAPFEISRDGGPTACIARLHGDIDIAVVPSLRAALDAELECGCINVVLDLTDVTYADSSALGLIVWLDHKVRPSGGRLVLAGAQTDVARVLELSGLVSLAASISMSSNVSAALEGLELPATPTSPLWQREIVVPADVNELATVRESICEIIAPLGFPDSAIFDIKVALGEALANAIRHGAPDTGQGEILARIVAFADRVTLEIMDSGAGFDGRHTTSEDVYAPNGRGIMFMRALMDRVEFDRSELGGTRVTLTKHRMGTAGAASHNS